MIVLKPIVFLLGMLPLCWYLTDWFYLDNLPVEPVEAMIHESGIWGLYFLFITLCLTPMSQLLHKPWPIQLRRMLGLFAFLYCSLHLFVHLKFNLELNWAWIIEEVAQRQYILVGFVVYVILLLLALTSPKFMVRMLGGSRWKRLHRWVYIALIGAVAHFMMQEKVTTLEGWVYLAIAVTLLLVRLPTVRRGLQGVRR